jgi:RNA polymerase sigma-70 factor, ECF subfamily
MTANSTQLAVSEVKSDDLELVHACKKGDVTAFEQLVKRYGRRLLRISQTVTRNREDSEDAVQEALLKAFQNLAEFREDSQFSTWLIRITVNQSLMKLRKQRTHKEVSSDEDFKADGDGLPLDVPNRAPNPEQLCWASELRDILVRTVGELRPILRTVFVLRDVEGLSIEQTAQVLNLSQATVISARRASPDEQGVEEDYRLDHGPDVRVLENQSPTLAGSPDDYINHRSARIPWYLRSFAPIDSWSRPSWIDGNFFKTRLESSA